MMPGTFTIALDTTGPAFGSTPQERSRETARVLRDLASRVEEAPRTTALRIRDVNGASLGLTAFTLAPEAACPACDGFEPGTQPFEPDLPCPTCA